MAPLAPKTKIYHARHLTMTGIAAPRRPRRPVSRRRMTEPDDLDALSSHELHDRAVRRALHHLDVGFLWELLRALPAGEAAAGHPDTPPPTR